MCVERVAAPRSEAARTHEAWTAAKKTSYQYLLKLHLALADIWAAPLHTEIVGYFHISVLLVAAM